MFKNEAVGGVDRLVMEDKDRTRSRDLKVVLLPPMVQVLTAQMQPTDIKSSSKIIGLSCLWS